MSKDLRTTEKVFKALANKRRLLVLKYLRKVKEARVGDIAEEIKLSFKATSKHLSILLSADLVVKDQRSLNVYYSINPSADSLAKSILSIL